MSISLVDQNTIWVVSPTDQTSCGWTHVLCHDSEPVSQYYDLFIPIVDHIQDRLGCSFNYLSTETCDAA